MLHAHAHARWLTEANSFRELNAVTLPTDLVSRTPAFEARPAETGPEKLARLPKVDAACRAVIEDVTPEINGGRYPIKRIPGDKVVVEAEVIADSHDLLSAAVRFRHASETKWSETGMEPLGNDRWRGVFTVTEVGECRYTVIAWVDHFKSWRSDLEKRLATSQEVSVELVVGARLVEAAADRAGGEEARLLRAWAKEFGFGDQSSLKERVERALDEELAGLTLRFPDRRLVTT